MPEYLSPGVYVEEVDSGSKPIEGVSTSTTGFVGMTVRGSTAGPPLLVTSFPDFRRQFGGYLPASLGDASYLAYAVEGFFNNLGQLAYVKRVLGIGNATAGSAPIGGGLITRLATDVHGGATSVQLTTLRGIQNGTQLTLTMVKNVYSGLPFDFRGLSLRRKLDSFDEGITVFENRARVS